MMIVIQKASGGVAVMRLLGDSDAADCLDKWKAVNAGEYVSHAVVDDASLPADRSQRQHWQLVDGTVQVVLPS